MGAEDCDVVVVNTCGFLQEAKEEALSEIARLVQQKREGKLQKILVAGCLAERYKEEIETMERLYLDGCYGPFITEDEEGTLLGYALLWGEKNGRYILLDYLGVSKERRNGGIGAELLMLLQEKFRKIDGIIGEVEAAGEEDDM